MSEGADQRQPQSERVADLVDRRIASLVADLKVYFEQQLKSDRDMADLRWSGWEKLDAAALRLIDARINGLERNLDIQTQATDRRLTSVDHEHGRLAEVTKSYVLIAVYDKDMERLYNEKTAQNNAARDARIHAEAAAATNRRTLTMGIIGFIISIMIAVVSVGLHFAPGHG
jgi:hypothetical protein